MSFYLTNEGIKVVKKLIELNNNFLKGSNENEKEFRSYTQGCIDTLNNLIIV